MSTAIILDATIRAVRAAQAEHVPPAEAAHAALKELNRFISYPSLEIAEWDPHLEQHRPVHAESFPPALLDALNGEIFTSDLCWPSLHRDSTPKGWADTDAHVARGDSILYQDFVLPSGYREGIYVPLFHQGRYVGMVTGNTDAPRPPGTDEKAALHAVAPILGEYVFRSRTRRTSSSDRGTLLLDPSLNLLSFEPEQSAGAATSVQGALRQSWPDRGRITRFSVWPETDRSPLRVQVEQSRNDAGGYYVTWTRGAVPGGLSRRQTEVVTGIVEGLSNSIIGEKLFASPRTIAKHVENILMKLGVPNRSAVTRLAMTEGIYLLGHPALTREIDVPVPPVSF